MQHNVWEIEWRTPFWLEHKLRAGLLGVHTTMSTTRHHVTIEKKWDACRTIFCGRLKVHKYSVCTSTRTCSLDHVLVDVLPHIKFRDKLWTIHFHLHSLKRWISISFIKVSNLQLLRIKPTRAWTVSYEVQSCIEGIILVGWGFQKLESLMVKAKHRCIHYYHYVW